MAACSVGTGFWGPLFSAATVLCHLDDSLCWVGGVACRSFTQCAGLAHRDPQCVGVSAGGCLPWLVSRCCHFAIVANLLSGCWE